MSRELTEKEVKEKFLEEIKSGIKEVIRINKPKEESLNLLAFCILVILDGESVDFPGCAVIPLPHSEDKEYCIESNENYYPDNIDIAGNLHHEFHNGVEG